MFRRLPVELALIQLPVPYTHPDKVGSTFLLPPQPRPIRRRMVTIRIGRGQTLLVQLYDQELILDLANRDVSAEIKIS